MASPSSSSSSSSVYIGEVGEGYKRGPTDAGSPPAAKVRNEASTGPTATTSETVALVRCKHTARKSTGAREAFDVKGRIKMLEYELVTARAERDAAIASMNFGLSRLKAVLDLVALLENIEVYSLIKQRVRLVISEFEGFNSR